MAIYANITPEFHKSNTLQLNAEVAAGIFQGNITTWDNPAILALNPNLTCGFSAFPEHVPPQTLPSS